MIPASRGATSGLPEGSSSGSENPIPQRFSISAVERDTGLSKETLRVWERRYGFPRPARDDLGERAYGRDEVNKLRVIRRLLDLGHRPGKLIGLSLEQLQELAAAAAQPGVRAGGRRGRAARVPETPPAAGEDPGPYLELIKAHRVEDLRDLFAQAALRLGLARFVGSLVAKLNEEVGNAWTRGELEVFEEHLYTEAVQGVLRNAISALAQPGRRPSVLLTTFPLEPHALGILMAEAIFALEGCRCLALGVQTPIWDIALAASGREIDIVALSFTGTLAGNAVLDGLTQLRERLPAEIEIWAGGRCPTLQRRPPADVRTFTSLEQIGPALAQWRAAHGTAA